MSNNTHSKKPIFDNVHGFIYADPLEISIINSSFFQRLRDIKQLGLVEFVFPGASHNRFNHSLGVMHLAGKMADSIIENQQERGEKELDRKKIRLAALLHDIGHYPWSHTVEHVVRKHADSKNIPFWNSKETQSKPQLTIEFAEESEENVIKEIQIPKDPHLLNCRINGEGDYAHHEKMAGIVIYNSCIYDLLRKDGLTDDDIDDICKYISGQYSEGPEQSLIHSELDADRFDYLLRDSYHTGVSYGNFDVEQIIRYLDIQLDPNGDEKSPQESSHLVVNKKGQRAVEDYLIARYFLYSTVIYHKANISFNAIAERVYQGLLERNLTPSYVDILEWFEKTSRNESNHPYLDYTDTSLIRLLRDICSKKEKLSNCPDAIIPSDMLYDLVCKIVYREPLKQIYENTFLTDQKNRRPYDEIWKMELLKQKQRFKEKKLEDSWLIQTHVTTSVTSIKPYVSIFDGQSSANPDQAIRIFNPKDQENPISILSDDETSIIKVLADKDLIIRGLYTKNEKYKNILNSADE